MPSLTNRKNGLPVLPTKGTKANIVLRTSSKYYNTYMRLRTDDKTILDSILSLMGTNTNQIVVLGDTLEAISELSGYSTSTIKSSVSRLSKDKLILPTYQLTAEYIINPSFAYKGNEDAIWEFIQAVHYKGNTPREVLFIPEN